MCTSVQACVCVFVHVCASVCVCVCVRACVCVCTRWMLAAFWGEPETYHHAVVKLCYCARYHGMAQRFGGRKFWKNTSRQKLVLLSKKC